MNTTIEQFFKNAKKWKAEFEQLRTIVLDCKLTEELKWGKPCYTLDNANIVLIHGFKEYCALLFMKGALLKDAKGILVQQTENVQSARQIRFTNMAEIVKSKTIVKSYIKEAIAVEKAGMKVELKKTDEYKMPIEFEKTMNLLPELKNAFYKLTPGRQRGYLLHFSSAKQSETRAARIEKYVPHILAGKGLTD